MDPVLVIADAHILAAKTLLSPSTLDDRPVDGEVFNITNDEPWPFWDFAHAISAAAGIPRHERVGGAAVCVLRARRGA
ncbi:hypothetical protein RJZ57_001799 [Blastomyces gilchristii]